MSIGCLTFESNDGSITYEFRIESEVTVDDVKGAFWTRHCLLQIQIERKGRYLGYYSEPIKERTLV
jgi:hypothetical protein